MPPARAKANRSMRALADRVERRSDGPIARIVDASLAGCLFLVPFLMGGRHPLGQTVLIALCVTAAVAWAIGQALRPRAPFRPTWLAPILLAGVAVLIVQLIPLPEPLLDTISPKIGDLLPLWHSQPAAAARLGTWQTLSLTPAATRDGLMLLSAYVLLFLVTVQRAERMEDVERLLRWSAAAAALTAIYALVQLVAGNGKFFWFYEPPYGNTLDAARANFTNRNHFAQFLALGTGPLIWWVHDAFRKNRASLCAAARLGAAMQPRHEGKTYLLALTLGLLLFAGFLSLSRGGMAAIVLAAALTAAVCWRASAGNKSFVAILAGVGILVALLLNIFGLDRVSPRFEDLESCSVQRLDTYGARRSIWTAVARGVREFSAFGTGVGSHAEAYPIYYSNELYEDREFTHAESSYLQAALETGLTGLALVVAAVVCCGVWCVGGLIRAPSARIVACLGAVTGSLAASAVHALVDFVWYVPACMVMIVILSACAARLWRLARSPLGQPPEASLGRGPEMARHSRVRSDSMAALQGAWVLPRLAYLAAAAVLLTAGAWTIKSQVQAAVAEPAWDSYRKSRIAMEKELERAPEATLDAARRAAAQEAERRRIDLLEAVVRRQPDHARAHLDLVESYLRLFDVIQVESENPMSLANVRDAAQRSHFPSREALDVWLRRAVGEHARYLDRALEHARRAMALCPLQGRGYLYLAELCFLENAGEGWKRACIEQALRVRPLDGEVLYAAATEALLAGDYDRWLEFARRSFQCGRRHQRKLIADLIGRSPPEVLEDVIQGIVGEFQPDLEALRGLREAARQHARPEKLVWLERHIAERAEADAKSARGEAAARLWNEARGLYASTGDAVRAAECAQSAAASDPQSFEARYGLGLTLMAQGQPAEAEPHLRWCLQRRPNDSGVEAKWKEALKGRLDEHRETAARQADQRHSY